MTLSVAPEDAEETLLGKNVADLQKDISVSESRISGELYHVTDYTEFSGDPELQEGHYVALKFEIPEDATGTIQLLGGATVRPAVELDVDMNAVLRITDPYKQKLRVVVTKDGYTDLVKEYRFGGVKLLAEEAPDNG